MEGEFTFAGLRRMKLDIDRVVAVGRYAIAQDLVLAATASSLL